MDTRRFGGTSQGESTLYTFRNRYGMVMAVTDFGATLQSLLVPTCKGLVDVVLGCDNAAGYARSGGAFFGATVGRNANRVGGGQFTLGGKTYALEKNDGPNNLHSGPDSYGFRLWQVKSVTDNAITFALHSPDGDQGFPGALDVEVTYTLTNENAVRIDYLAVPQADTPVNLTNHSYFNLDGHDSGSVLKHSLWLDANCYTPVDANLIPTGEIASVDNPPRFDFRECRVIAEDYDNNWCLKNGGEFRKAATLFGKQSGLSMDVYTDRPGIQIYTGYYVSGEPGKGGITHCHSAGVCFETQHYPDAVNHPNFPSPIVKAGDTFRSSTEFRFCGVPMWEHATDMYVRGLCRLYDAPNDTGRKLDWNQGKLLRITDFGEQEKFEGTCGIVACVNLLRMAGWEHITERDVLNYALANKLCNENMTPGENGGTTPTQRQTILAHFGLASAKEAVSIQRIADYVSAGKGVIVCVDAGKLWQDPRYENELHAIVITSVKLDPDNQPIGFHFCDPGRHKEEHRNLYCTADSLKEALERDLMNVTTRPIR